MYTQDDYEQIEAYLNNDLPDPEHRDFEQRMADDGAFRREVIMHRRAQQIFQDPGLWRLWETLAEVRQAAPKASEPPDFLHRINRWHLLFTGLFLALAVLIGWAVWQMDRPVSVSPAPVLEQKKGEAPPVQPSPPVEKTPVPEKLNLTKPAPIAADFVPLKKMEDAVNRQLRSAKIAFTKTSPMPDADFVRNKNGEVAVRFSGTLDEETRLEASIFNNRAGQPALASTNFLPLTDGADAYLFDFPFKLPLPPGLYYFTIKEQRTGGNLAAGRFTVHDR